MTGFIVRINWVRIRQEISKHISIAYNMLHWTIFMVISDGKLQTVTGGR